MCLLSALQWWLIFQLQWIPIFSLTAEYPTSDGPQPSPKSKDYPSPTPTNTMQLKAGIITLTQANNVLSVILDNITKTQVSEVLKSVVFVLKYIYLNSPKADHSTVSVSLK